MTDRISTTEESHLRRIEQLERAVLMLLDQMRERTNGADLDEPFYNTLCDIRHAVNVEQV